MRAGASRRTATRAVAGLLVAAASLRHPEATLAAPLVGALLEWWPVLRRKGAA